MTDLMQGIDEIGKSALDNLREAQMTGEGVRLPFPAANAWVINGDVKAKAHAAECPTLYFGGWAMDQEAVGELVEDGALPIFPKNWTSYTGNGERGDYQSIANRTISFAPIAFRSRWLASDGKAYGPKYNAEAGFKRQHIQYLAQWWVDGAPFGYVVLTAKGFQSKNLMEAIGAWDKAISLHRKALNATQIPVGGFVITVGTIGTAPNFVAVGGAGAQSKITPVAAIIPDGLNAEQVSKRFIGKANIAANGEKLAEAKEWLTAWRAPVAEQPTEEHQPIPDGW